MRYSFLFFLTLCSATLFADIEEKFKINLGAMYVTDFETEMQIGPSNKVLSATVNTNDQLGMKYDTNVFRIDGSYRFNEIHSVDFSYFTVKSSGNKVITQEISDWGENNDTIGAGADVNSYFNMDIYKLNYAYSFYHNKDVELGLSIGLHITNLDLGLSASGEINGVSSQALVSSTKLLAPLPVVGFRGEYTIIEKRLFAQYKADYFYLQFDDFAGSFISTTLNLEYRFLENYGVGLGYNANRLEIEADNGTVGVNVKNSLNGVIAYFTYIY